MLIDHPLDFSTKSACQFLLKCLEKTVDVGSAERTVKQTVTGLTGLAPDHSAVVGAYVAVEAALNERANYLVYVERAAGGKMCSLLE